MSSIRSNRYKSWLVGIAAIAVISVATWAADAPALQSVATADQLKSQAFKALREGQFQKTTELLAEASRLNSDPDLARMVRWTGEFEAQRRQFAAERRKEYDKTVADAHKLIAGGKFDYAVTMAARAYPLTDHKAAFRAEPWVDALLKTAVTSVEKYEQSEQWIKALRLYSDLGAIEQANPLWKEKLKQVTRRIRLLALYTPAELRASQEAESKDREEIEAILKPATAPATKPTTRETADTFQIDWNETLRGVKMDMLTDALVDTLSNYYRETTYRDLLTGGLKGMQILATTRGLEKTFPNLGDLKKRGAFLAGVKDLLASVGDANNPNEVQMLSSTLAKLRTLNKETIALQENVLVSEFADGAFGELDPFTGMIWPNDLEEFQKATQGEFSGVGIQIQNDDDGSLKVVSPLEDSPAYRAGIKAGDIITHINGKSAKGITLNQAVKNITGPQGTVVSLTVKSPSGESRVQVLKRETIKVASIKGWSHRPGGGWEYFIDSQEKIGYLRITNFTKTTGADLEAAMAELARKGAKGVIVDLRYNPGGRLDAAIEVVDRFLGEGVIVSTKPDRKTPNQPSVASAKEADDDAKMAVVVLVNQYSASASEIVSGALKDQHRAMIVGERTFGKGSVQMLFPLAGQTAYLKLTTSHYYLPSGKCIHREENSKEWGVDPDLTVEMTPEQMRLAIDARQELDVLRDANPSTPPTPPNAPTTRPTTGKSKDPLSCDAQLSAALLLLRFQVAGAQL